MYKNLMFFKYINALGGTEQFLYEIVKKYSKKYDIVIAFENADVNQLYRLSKYVDCIQWHKGKKIKCEKAFLNFNADIIDDLECNDITFVCHAIFNEIGYRPPSHERIDRVLAVSSYAAESVSKYFDLPIEYSYNPITLENYEKPLILCSAFRMNDKTKGGDRVRELIKHLDDYCLKTGRHYLYLIFTDKLIDPIESKNVCVMPPRTDVRAYFPICDWGITLSNNMETYCYTNVEFLMNNVPIVTTPLTIAEELEMDSSMRLICDWDMSNVDEIIEQMFNKKMRFEYIPPEDRWDEILSQGVRSKNTMDQSVKLFKVRATNEGEYRGIYIAEAGGIPKENQEFVITEDRISALTGDNKYRLKFVDVIEEVKRERIVEEVKEELPKTEKKTRKKVKNG